MKEFWSISLGLIFLLVGFAPYGLAIQESKDESITQPLAHITWEQEEVENTRFFSLSATSSLDPDHLITSYEWIYIKNGTLVGEYYGPYLILEVKEDGQKVETPEWSQTWKRVQN